MTAYILAYLLINLAVFHFIGVKYSRRFQDDDLGILIKVIKVSVLGLLISYLIVKNNKKVSS